MASQDAQDITQMMGDVGVPSATGGDLRGEQKPGIKVPKLLLVVLGCVVVGVGLGVLVYQQSLKPTAPPPTTKVSPMPTSVAASPAVPNVSTVTQVSNKVTFPKTGKLRIYYLDLSSRTSGSYKSVLFKVTKGGQTTNIDVPGGTVTTPMKIFDTNMNVTANDQLTITSFWESNTDHPSMGWVPPKSGKCGENGNSLAEISTELAWATTQSGTEPVVSQQCWADYSLSAQDPSVYDFNDYFVVWSYVPAGASASPSSSPSTSPSASPSVSPSISPSLSPSPSPSPSPTRSPSPSPSPSPSAKSPSPSPSQRASASPRVAMPDTSAGVPVTGVFEVTVGTVGVGMLLVLAGLLGLLLI